MGTILRGDAVRLAAVLAGGALLAFLFRDGSGAAAGVERNPEHRAMMPEISAPDLHGNPWRLADQRGFVVLVNFWASWCPPCRAEMPSLVRLSNAYHDRGVRMAGVSMDDSIEPVRSFVAEFHVPYPVIKPDGQTGPASSIESLPTSFLIDRHGRIAKTYVGAVQEAELATDLDWVLAENQ